MFLWILALHFVADFICQSHWMAANKSKNANALATHVMIYAIIMAAGVWTLHGFYPPVDPYYRNAGQIIQGFGIASLFFTATFFTHLMTDAVTSRLTSKLFAGALKAYDEKDSDAFGSHIHDFFVIVGADQLIHAVTLYWSLRFLGFPV